MTAADEFLVAVQIDLPEPMDLSDDEGDDEGDEDRHRDVMGHVADWLRPIATGIARQPSGHIVTEAAVELQWRTFTVAEAEILGAQAMGVAAACGYGIIGSEIVPYHHPAA